MTDYSFESYGERARLLEDPTSASGRLLMREDAARRIVHDIIHKLDIQPTDTLCDIGCGIGQVGIPLSFMVKKYIGIDHPDVVKRFSERLPNESNVTLMGGKFPKTVPEGEFSKVLVYDAVHYMDNAELSIFIDAAVHLLKPGGKMLIGSIPNASLKQRFYGSALGQKYGLEWNEAFERGGEAEVAALIKIDRHAVDPNLPKHWDNSVLEIVAAYRRAGFDCWIVPEDWRLPMGVEREDLIVRRA